MIKWQIEFKGVVIKTVSLKSSWNTEKNARRAFNSLYQKMFDKQNNLKKGQWEEFVKDLESREYLKFVKVNI